MNIKVCGINSFKQLQQLDGLDLDFAGLNFYKDSPRYIGDKINAKELVSADLDVKIVGIFVNENMDTILEKVEEYNLDIVQLHGEESPEFCEDLSEDIEVIKAFAIPADKDIDLDKLVAPYDAVCDYYLFDTASEGKGGSGKKFNWECIKKAKIEKPFFLGGGVSVEDAAAIKALKHPDFFAVDINSQFEKTPGEKDMGKVLEFKLAVK